MKVTLELFKAAIELHKRWLAGDPSGKKMDFSYANFRGTDFIGANFRGADFSYANFRGADFSYANFRGTDFIGANFRGADFSYANFRGADFRGADNFSEVINVAKIEGTLLCMQCPTDGDFIGYKKCSQLIVELKITDKSRRSSATSKKCRCSEAEVVSITNLDGTASDKDSVPSGYDPAFIYSVGKTVCVENFDADRWNECAPGIHFFINRIDAINY